MLIIKKDKATKRNRMVGLRDSSFNPTLVFHTVATLNSFHEDDSHHEFGVKIAVLYRLHR
jgi:hypothetical protein